MWELDHHFAYVLLPSYSSWLERLHYSTTWEFLLPFLSLWFPFWRSTVASLIVGESHRSSFLSNSTANAARMLLAADDGNVAGLMRIFDICSHTCLINTAVLTADVAFSCLCFSAMRLSILLAVILLIVSAWWVHWLSPHVIFICSSLANKIVRALQCAVCPMVSMLTRQCMFGG